MSGQANRATKTRWFVGALTLAAWMLAGGCGDFFAEKSVELEAERALDGLTQITTVPDANIAKPAVYQNPPEIVRQTVAGVEEYKLFYFCRYHTSDKLKQVIHEQFATQLFDEKGKATNAKDYTVSSSPATNQLVVRCPTQDDVEAVLEVLQAVDIPPIQVKIDCMISEIYADLTMDRETTVLIKDLFGEDIFIGGKTGPSTFVGATEIPGELYPAFPGAALREVARSRFGLKVGYVNGDDVTALIDILESRGYLKIVMNPTLEVVNGQVAKISSSEHVPLQQVTSYLPTKGEYIMETRTEYVDVVDSLEVTPFVFADGYIALQTTANISSKNTPEGVKQVPIVTKREITNKENRIRQGESLIIGGIRKSERFAVVRGVPFLKDIPILGLLFSSKDFEERAKETIFILTPTISTGGVPNKEVVDRILKEHEPPVPVETLHDTMTDPFGFSAREREHRQELLDAEQMRLEAETEKASARGAVRAAEQKAALVEEDAAKTLSESQQMKDEAEKIRAEAEGKAQAAEAAKAAAEAKAKAADAAKAAAERAAAEAASVKAQAEMVAADATKSKAEADQAKVAAEAVAQAADAAKAEADKAAAEAQQSKTEAERIRVEAEAKAKVADAVRAAAEKVAAEAEQSKVETERIRAYAEAKAKAETEARAEAERAKTDAEAKARAEAQARAEAERARVEAEARAKAEAEARAVAEAERIRAETEAEAAAKAEAERANAEAEAKAKAEAEAGAKAEAEAEAAAQAEAERARIAAEAAPEGEQGNEGPTDGQASQGDGAPQ